MCFKQTFKIVSIFTNIVTETENVPRQKRLCCSPVQVPRTAAALSIAPSLLPRSGHPAPPPAPPQLLLLSSASSWFPEKPVIMMVKWKVIIQPPNIYTLLISVPILSFRSFLCGWPPPFWRLEQESVQTIGENGSRRGAVTKQLSELCHQKQSCTMATNFCFLISDFSCIMFVSVSPFPLQFSTFYNLLFNSRSGTKIMWHQSDHFLSFYVLSLICAFLFCLLPLCFLLQISLGLSL